MADIQLRFDKDVLVLSGPIQTGLMQLGTNTQRDAELTMLLEPEVFEDAYKLQQFAGAQCLVAYTAGLTPARLAHVGMREQGSALAKSALDIIDVFNPQHKLVEIAPCGLPLDAASKQSLNESCDQYKRAVQFFEGLLFDAFFLNGFTRCADLKCALMGIRKVSGAPIFASVNVDVQGYLVASEWAEPLPSGETLKEAARIMAEYEAQVVGFNIVAPVASAVAFVEQIREVTYLPILVQLQVEKDSPYNNPDTMIAAADELCGAGVQFLRAVGKSTPAYTGALVAATEDCSVVLPSGAHGHNSGKIDEPLEDVAARLRKKVNAAITKQPSSS